MHGRPAPTRTQAPPPVVEDSDDDPEATDDVIPTASPNTSSTLLAEARRELAAARESHYAHHTSVDEARGSFDYDCSGFVGYALARATPQAFAAVTAATRARPLAKDFYAFFAIFSTMIGAVGIARILPDQTARARVLANARDFLLRSF